MQKKWIGSLATLLCLVLAGCQSTPVIDDPAHKGPLPEVNVIERDASISMSELSRAGAAMRLPHYEDTLYNHHLGAVASESDRRNALPAADLLTAQKAEKDKVLQIESERLNQRAQKLKKPQRIKGDKSFYVK